VDLCILCGCDYTTNIPGIGPIKAFKFIEECKTIEEVIKKIEKENENPAKKKKYAIPANFHYEESRKLFNEPDVITDKAVLQEALKWDKPDEAALKDFLVAGKGFNDVKVENGLKRLKACQGKTNQARLDCFFKAGPPKTSALSNPPTKLTKGGAGAMPGKKSMPAKK